MANAQRDVTLIYEDVDITGDVDITECVLKDVSGGESDCLNLKLAHAEKWFRWGPKKNDRIRVTRAGYDSKTLFLNTIAPEDGEFRIYATGAKSVPFPAKWQAFGNMNFLSVMSLCAGEAGMGARAFGVDTPEYEYLLRENMSAPAFLCQLAGREGAALKAMNGQFTAIGVGYAQGLPAKHEMRLDNDQTDSEYIDRRALSWTNVTIETPFGRGSARDSAANGQSLTITGLAVDNDAMARRWARGILLMHNRQAEILNIEMDFNPGYTAMVRVDVNSGTDAAGQWIIDSVEQNLLDGRTKAKLFRCLTTIS